LAWSAAIAGSESAGTEIYRYELAQLCGAALLFLRHIIAAAAGANSNAVAGSRNRVRIAWHVGGTRFASHRRVDTVVHTGVV
jgi:hypothetical protein